jgi:hypothetical protein
MVRANGLTDPVGLPPADIAAWGVWPDAARRQSPLSPLQEKRGESYARPASAVIAARGRWETARQPGLWCHGRRCSAPSHAHEAWLGARCLAC